MRDADEARLVERLLGAAGALPPGREAGEERRERGGADEGPPSCPHHGPGKESTQAPGTWYCTKRMADQSYCTWRHPAK